MTSSCSSKPWLHNDGLDGDIINFTLTFDIKNIVFFVQTLFSLMQFRRKNRLVNSFRCNLIPHGISTKLCTRHHSTAVVLCTKTMASDPLKRNGANKTYIHFYYQGKWVCATSSIKLAGNESMSMTNTCTYTTCHINKIQNTVVIMID